MEGMTPDQRLDRAERILIAMIKSGRRTRSEWQYKINSLIDAQIKYEAASRREWDNKINSLNEARIKHEAAWRIEAAKTEELLG
jgi:UDP-glucose 4-epimerase